ncbi:MAG: helix-turn-helix domain-containing protein [Bacteroidetes bacterium]|nr:helix-turn-helix domain-containing protein [Bacteroidota bacterium]
MTPKQLQKIRKGLKYNQTDFAKLLGFSREKLSLLERGVSKIDYATELVINDVVNSVNNPQKKRNSKAKVSNTKFDGDQQVGYSGANPFLNQDQMSMAMMVNASTASVSLDLICEILSVVSDRPLEEIKGRASSMLKERGAKLQVVLDSLF